MAGFATHPHWDHLLWHARYGDVPRYATPGCAQLAEAARDRLNEAAQYADVLIPGHGSVAKGPEVAARLAADRAYALRQGGALVRPVLAQDWLAGPHQSNLNQAEQPAG